EDLPPEVPPPITPGPSAGSSKTPLLSRIGSVGKKWGAGRKKRASAAAAALDLAGVELWVKLGELTSACSAARIVRARPRQEASDAEQSRELQATFSIRERGISQCGRYSQGPSETESAEQESIKTKEGSRSFMGGMRRISLGATSKHKRTPSKVPEQQTRKSSGAATIRAEKEPAEDTTPRPPSRVIPTPNTRAVPLSSSALVIPLGDPSGISSLGRGRTFDVAHPITTAVAHEIEACVVSGAGSVVRRNSLGDLKIPARISQAQVGLRRDLGMVREFAASIEQLKQLQQTYHSLVGEIQSVMYGEQPPGAPSRALTPTLFGLPKPSSRVRSNTNPAPSPVPQSPHELIIVFHSVESKYQISWECAELLIELGSGAPPHPSSAPTPDPASTSAPAILPDGRKSRERAVTLAGDEPKPIIIAPGTLRDDGFTSTYSGRGLELGASEPEDSTQVSGLGASAAAAAAKKQKRRSSKLGMRGIRDMLKSLKKSYAENPPTSLSPIPPSTTSVSASTGSSINNMGTESWHQSLVQRRRAKTSTGPESMKSTRERDRHPNSPYATSMSLHRSSPRRPSLASIFRIGQKNKSHAGSNEQSSDDLRSSNPSSATSGGASGLTEEDGEEDWDQVESAFDLERAARMLEKSTATDTTVAGLTGLCDRWKMANIGRAPKAGDDWTPNDLLSLPQGDHVKEVLSVPDVSAAEHDDSYTLLRTMELAMTPHCNEESAVVDFVVALFRLLGFVGRAAGRTTRTRKALPFWICGHKRHATADVCIVDDANIIRFLVQEDKRHADHPDSEPQLIAAAVATFSNNNHARIRCLGASAFASEVICGIIMKGTMPTFYRIPITLDLCRGRLRYIEGMTPLDNRAVVLACFEEIKHWQFL
ncbi:hypothetical protein EVJ58_g4715, partial [Rhodofomes roseus]